MDAAQPPSSEKHALPLVVLDRRGQVCDFAPEAAAVFRLAASDRGAPFAAALARAGLQELWPRIRDVLETGSAAHFALGSNSHQHALAVPNHSPDGTVSGASIAIIEKPTVGWVPLAQAPVLHALPTP